MQSVEFVLFFLQLYISCFRLVLRIGIRDTADTVSLQFLWIALPPFNYTQVSSANHMVPVAFISIWMRTSKDIQIQDDPSNAAKNHIFYQTVLAFLRDRPQNVPRAYCITASVWLYSSKVCQNSCNELCQSVYLRAPVFVQFTEFTELQHVMLHPASLKTVLHAAPRTVGSVCPGCKCDWMLALQVLGSHGPFLARGKRHSHESS